MQEWNFLMDRYMGTSNSIEQRNIMAGLGCSTDADTLNRYVDVGLISGVRI